MLTSNVEKLSRLLLEGFGEGDVSLVDEVVSEDFIEHQIGAPNGREGLKSVIRTLRSAFPDIRCTVIRIAEDGDKVKVLLRSSGTHQNQPFEVDVIDIARFEAGKMVEHWAIPDRIGLLLRFGVSPFAREGGR